MEFNKRRKAQAELKYRVVDSDLEIFKKTKNQLIKLSEINEHPYFSKKENFTKLCAFAVIYQQSLILSSVYQNSLTEIISNNVVHQAQLALDLLDLADISKIKITGLIVSSELQSQLAQLNDDILDEESAENVIKNYPFEVVLSLLRRALRLRKLSYARRLMNSLDKRAQVQAAGYLVGVAHTISYLVQKVGSSFRGHVWNSYIECLEQFIGNISAELSQLALTHRVKLQIKVGQAVSALVSAKTLGPEHASLINFCELHASVQSQNYGLAVRQADKIIRMLNPVNRNEEKGGFDRNAAEIALLRANSILRAAGVKIFPISGTLLGLTREGRIFEHDKDFDLGVIGWLPQFDIASALISSGEFFVNHAGLKGAKTFMLDAKHLETGYTFDIFLFHDRGDHFLHGIDSRAHYTLNYKFSKFNLIEAEFLGQSFYIPEQTNRMLSENYGNDWMIPNPNYFVKIESPALFPSSLSLRAWVVREEMLMLHSKGASAFKAKRLIEVSKKIDLGEFVVPENVNNAFLKSMK